MTGKIITRQTKIPAATSKSQLQLISTAYFLGAKIYAEYFTNMFYVKFPMTF